MYQGICCLEKEKNMFAAFTDIEKAYDIWQSVEGRLVGDFKRIWSEGQDTWIHKAAVQRGQGLCKGEKGKNL